jgi:hypothetical protein
MACESITLKPLPHASAAVYLFGVPEAADVEEPVAAALVVVGAVVCCAVVPELALPLAVEPDVPPVVEALSDTPDDADFAAAAPDGAADAAPIERALSDAAIEDVPDAIPALWVLDGLADASEVGRSTI